MKIVYTRLGRLLLEPPGRLVYHRMNRSRSVFGADLEEHFTRCGRLIYRTTGVDYSVETHVRVFDGIREDNAELVGRPCCVCYRVTRRERRLRPGLFTQAMLDELLAAQPFDLDAPAIRVALVSEDPS